MSLLRKGFAGLLGAGLVGTAVLVGTGGSAQAAVKPLPAHVFAPYFETYADTHLKVRAEQSGAKYLTLAFLETPKRGSCSLAWDGDPSMSVAKRTFGHRIKLVRAMGGDVIPSFGGYSADNEGRDIADSCTSISKIAKAYERVVTTYDVSRLDLDVEDNSLNRPKAITRRSKAIHLVQEWAKAHHRKVHFSYTLPSSPSGLDAAGVKVLKSTYAHHGRVQVVNAMTFDFYDNQPHEMATDSETAAKAVIAQMHKVYPGQSTHHLWTRLGMTEMVGIDDFGAAETFTTDDATAVQAWATSHHLALLSFWALQRDNGGCPGTAGSDDCSGVSQTTWQFSHAFEPFTHR